MFQHLKLKTGVGVLKFYSFEYKCFLNYLSCLYIIVCVLCIYMINSNTRNGGWSLDCLRKKMISYFHDANRCLYLNLCDGMLYIITLHGLMHTECVIKIRKWVNY